VAELAGVVVLGAVAPLAVVAVAGGSASPGWLALAGGAAGASGLVLASTERLLPALALAVIAAAALAAAVASGDSVERRPFLAAPAEDRPQETGPAPTVGDKRAARPLSP
jgi:hypothetical protein